MTNSGLFRPSFAEPPRASGEIPVQRTQILLGVYLLGDCRAARGRAARRLTEVTLQHRRKLHLGRQSIITAGVSITPDLVLDVYE
jgi:hypothetical protein